MLRHLQRIKHLLRRGLRPMEGISNVVDVPPNRIKLEGRWARLIITIPITFKNIFFVNFRSNQF